MSWRTMGWLLTLLACLGLMAITWLVAHAALCGTPAVANFRAFAEPGGTRFDSRYAYLFSPFAVQAFAFVISVVFIRQTVRYEPKYMAVPLLIAGVMLAATIVQSGRAERAVVRTGERPSASAQARCLASRLAVRWL